MAPTAERGGKTGSAAAGIGAASSGGGGSSSLWQPHSSISNLHVSPAQIAMPIRGRQEDSEQGLAALAAATEAFADRVGKALASQKDATYAMPALAEQRCCALAH